MEKMIVHGPQLVASVKVCLDPIEFKWSKQFCWVIYCFPWVYTKQLPLNGSLLVESGPTEQKKGGVQTHNFDHEYETWVQFLDFLGA